MPSIRFTNNLDRHVHCPPDEVEGDTVLDALRSYFVKHERVEGYVLTESEQLRTHMTIFVDGQPILDRSNLNQQISNETVLDVIQALSGG
jgi:hypothetical protein